MKKPFFILLLICLVLPSLAYAEKYFAFSAEEIDFQGEKRIFFVPFSFDAPSQKSVEKKVGVLFEKLHGSRPTIYGETLIFLKQGADGQYEAYITVDPASALFADVIIGETFLTLVNIGVTKVFLAPDKRVTDNDLRYPYFLPTVPLWEALPPASFQHSLIRLGDNEYMESATFNSKLAAKDQALYTRILGLLQSKDPYVRLQVLKAFPLLGVAQSEKYLLPLLTDSEVAVQHRVIELLQDRKEPVVLDALGRLADSDKNPDTQLRAARILVANGRKSYEIYILFEQLNSPDPAVVVATLQKLSASNDKRVLPAIVKNLGHPNADVQAAAMAGLKQMKDLEALKLLVNSKDIFEVYRKEAALELMRQGEAAYSKEGIRYLLETQEGKDALEAVTTIEMRKYKDMAPELVKALSHADVEVAKAAVRVIGALDLVEHIKDLSAASNRGELLPVVRETIAAMMSRMQPEKVIELANNKDLLIRELAVSALVAIAKARKGGKVLDTVMETLDARMRDKNDVIKRAAAQALLDIGGPDNWNRLLRVKGDDDPLVRIIVLKAAASLANADGDKVIVAMLDDADDEVRFQALGFVRERKVKEARPKLKAMVMSPKAREKGEAIRAVAVLNETVEEHKEYFDVYAKALYDTNPDIQLAAILGIQNIIDPKVVPLLQSGLLLNHKDPRVRAATLVALGHSRDHNVIEDIARGFADEPIVQAAAIEALRLLGHQKAIRPLDEFIRQTDDEALKAAAQKALDEIKNKPKGIL